MDSTNRSRLPERNPKTHALHRREVFWQIIIPLLVGILLVAAAIGAIIFSALQPATGLDRWADVSLIWLIIPALFFALIVLVILIGIGYAITVLLRLLPRYARLIQLYFEVGRDKASQITDLLVAPIVKTHTAMAVVRQISRWKHPSVNE